MDLIPAIDIRGGKCVQLVQGDYARETVFGDDPVAMARRWLAEGATRLHVVDLDGAKAGRPVNDAVVRRIISDVAGLDVQVAGGIRDEATIDRWAEAGAGRIVLGTVAVEQPDLVARGVARHGERIAVAIDARDGKAAVKGWLETSGTTVGDFVREMASRGVQHFIYTDVARDGMLQHLNFEGLESMLGVLREHGLGAGLIYSGGVTSIGDVVALSQHDLEGAIIGTALYEGRIDLTEARNALQTGDGT